MRDFLAAIAEHPDQAVGLAVFILLVIVALRGGQIL